MSGNLLKLTARVQALVQKLLKLLEHTLATPRTVEGTVVSMSTGTVMSTPVGALLPDTLAGTRPTRYPHTSLNIGQNTRPNTSQSTD